VRTRAALACDFVRDALVAEQEVALRFIEGRVYHWIFCDNLLHPVVIDCFQETVKVEAKCSVLDTPPSPIFALAL